MKMEKKKMHNEESRMKEAALPASLLFKIINST